MGLAEVMLLVLSVGVVAGVPAYIYLRNSMVKKQSGKEDYSQKRVIKLTSINLLLNSVVAGFFFVIFSNLLQRVTLLSLDVIIFALLFVFMTCLTFYGNGIYITSIVLEAYTLPQLRKISYFKNQFIAIQLFHGPISHILVYSGWMWAMFMLVPLSLAGVPVSSLPLLIFFLGGWIVGAAYAGAQIYNGTSAYQLISGVLILILTLSIMITSHPRSASSIPVFLASFLSIFSSILIARLLGLHFSKKKFVWYENTTENNS